MRKYKSLTEEQRRGCILKVESGMNDAQIAREIGLTPQAINKWWKLAHIKRELGRQSERYCQDTLPDLIQEYQNIRDETLVKLRENLKGKVTIREATDVIKTMIAGLDAEFTKLETLREVAKEEESEENSWRDTLTPSERNALVRRMTGLTHGKILGLVDPIDEEARIKITVQGQEVEGL